MVHSAWPYKYVCDMVPGMRKMKELNGNLKGRFEEAFPNSRYVRSTWHTHVNIWDDAVKKPRFIERYTEAGRTTAGEWNKMKRDLVGKK